MNIEDKLDALRQIKEVDAPPFLLTRIRERIQSLETVAVPVKWKWVFAAASIIVLTLNFSLFFKTTTLEEKKAGIEEVLTTMHISYSNQLYHE